MPSGPRYPGFRSDASAPQGTVQWIDAPEEDVLPRIPGEQTKHEPATRAHDLDGDPHEHVEKRFEFHPEHGGFLSGSRPRGLVKPPAEIACRRRIRDALRTQRIQIHLVLASLLDILPARAPTQHVVRDAEHVI